MELSELHMRPLLAAAIEQAVFLALIDSCAADATDEERAAWAWDIYTMPDKLFAKMDPGALAKNVACRLIGKGNWTVGGCYSGNATPREALEACIIRPDQDPLGDIKMWLGAKEDSGGGRDG